MMKYLTLLLTIATLSVTQNLFADDTTVEHAPTTPVVEETNSAALTELCSTYAEEDGITDSKKPAYLAECKNNMTDLSENMQEDLPVVSEETGEVLATPSSEQLQNTPEKLVQNELVETPDPNAEQLNANK
ncbi:hypothetical protein [Thiothrix lacustris]|uniref:hypothetical protein n=1 Tax=Thiothrix lacustris TaxID=525917 RepID=UPI0027E49146|nr:hypothetical protein [Thiothrix lacustris]WMP19255.1 hypothetical protein RCS87_09450 [Thiothrix lacustris]